MRGHNKEIWLSLSRGWVLERCLRQLKNEEWGEGIGRKVMWQKSRNLGFQMPDTLWFQFRSPRIHTRNMHFHKHFRQSISSTNIYWARKWAWDSSRCWEFSNFFLINFSAFWFRGMISPKATQSMVFRASFRPAILRSSPTPGGPQSTAANSVIYVKSLLLSWSLFLMNLIQEIHRPWAHLEKIWLKRC